MWKASGKTADTTGLYANNAAYENRAGEREKGREGKGVRYRSGQGNRERLVPETRASCQMASISISTSTSIVCPSGSCRFGSSESLDLL